MISVATTVPIVRVEAVDLGPRTPLALIDHPTLVHLGIGTRYLTEEGQRVLPKALADMIAEGVSSGRWQRDHADSWHISGGLWRR